ITSNKYTRAGYGEALREFLLKNVSILEYTDFNGVKVFDSATVDTSILCFEKSKGKDNKFKYLALDNEILKVCAYHIDLCKDFKEFSQKSLSKESFTFSDENASALKAKIEKIGTPLKEWYGLNIYRGILTGYNEAFIISTEKRNEILANCKDDDEKERTAKLIRKMLRGRDIKRYSYEWAGLWVIGTFPSLKIDIEQYPALKQYLSQFLPRIEQSGEKGCRKKTSNKWFETQDNIAYYEEFEKEKIVYPCIMSKEPCFSYETNNFIAMAPANTITSESNILKYLIAFLNSDFIYLMLRKFYMGGGIEGELKTNNLEKLPIPKINSKNEKLADELINLVDEILKAKEQDKNANTKGFENRIDFLVYKLYNLTEDEIRIIEGI
ncbi:TPA: class I SAM-dependent DNA methyltransferase, partial [Campylobacter jejuni]|nr:class I SAM-dependent DNA methyltransferase [Campylobacter jejuni]